MSTVEDRIDHQLDVAHIDDTLRRARSRLAHSKRAERSYIAARIAELEADRARLVGGQPGVQPGCEGPAPAAPAEASTVFRSAEGSSPAAAAHYTGEALLAAALADVDGDWLQRLLEAARAYRQAARA